MKQKLLALSLLAAVSALHAAPWTYRGTLIDGGKPANGQYDVRVTLLNEAKTASLTSPITFYSVKVVDGNFEVNVDFGMDLSTSPTMALKTEVQQGGSGFVALGEATRFDPKAALGGACWDTVGNTGTNATTDFLGTVDNQALVLRTNNARSLRIEPSTELSATLPITANIIGGSRANALGTPFLGGGGDPVRGAVVAGGGTVQNGDPTYTTAGPNRATDHYSTVSGGIDNVAGNSNIGNFTDAPFATVSGGRGNTASDSNATVSGGIGNTASGTSSSVSGGTSNSASATASTVSGGSSNTAAGLRSTVSGGNSNCAGGDNSWVGGQNAKTRVGNGTGDGTCAASSGDANGDEGSFVWADQSSTDDFVTRSENQFIVRADGGFGVNTNFTGVLGTGLDDMVIRARESGDDSANLRLLAIGGLFANFSVDAVSGTMELSSFPATGQNRMSFSGGTGGLATLTNGGTWTNASSRSYKENFASVNGLDILSRLVKLPIMTWDYKGSSEGQHMGPVAEDFKATFGLAGDGKSISTVDADGIALAAIQGLNAKLESENAALRARLDALEARAK
jgi:trimeric autotransporter adhesin